MNRRLFLGSLAAASLAPFATLEAEARDRRKANQERQEALRRLDANEDPRVPVLQGMTSDRSAQFTVLRPATQRWSYEAFDSRSRVRGIPVIETFSFPGSSWEIDKLRADGLSAVSVYGFRIRRASDGVIVDERRFRTLDPKRGALRFAMASCMADHMTSSQGPMWEALAASRPEFLFLIGDNCYSDWGSDGSIDSIWRRYVETRRLLDVFRYQELIPCLATWDDHDYGLNNADFRFPLKDQTRRIFFALFGSYDDAGWSMGPGNSGVLEANGQKFFFMDDRSFRAPNETDGTHWGEAQENWLLSRLASNQRPSYLFNGSQFFGAYLGKESYEGSHRRSFQEILGRIGQTGTPVIFGSGDVHFSEIMEIEPERLGYTTYELTSSSIHSFTIPGHQYRAYNPRRLTSTWRHNFLVVESQLQRDGLALNVRSLTAASRELFNRDMMVSLRRRNLSPGRGKDGVPRAEEQRGPGAPATIF